MVEDSPVRTATSDYPELVVEWLPTVGPFASGGDWCDITEYVTGGSCSSGRQYELERFQAGSCDLTLTASTRLFDPDYTAGPFYPWLIPMRQLRISAVWNSVRYPVWRGYITDWGSTTVSADNQFVTQVKASDALALMESISLPASWYEFVVADDRPTHWWKLDEQAGTRAVDSGFGTTLHDGSYVNSPTLDNVQLVSYDGGRKGPTFTTTNSGNTDSYARVLVNETVGAFTFSGWFSTTATVLFTYIFQATSSTGTLPFGAYLDGSGTVYAFVGEGGGVVFLTSATGYNDGNPHHIAITYAGGAGGACRLYLDGALIDSDVATLSATVTNVEAGSFGYDNNDASLASLSWWVGRALTAAQISAHYTAATSAYSGYDTGTHLARILDYRGWPTVLRNIETGASTFGTYELAAVLSDAVTQVADTEAGQTYVDTQGRISHRNRQNLWLDARSQASQATFGDAHSAATLKYVTDGFQLVRDQQRIRNPVSATRSGGVTATAEDRTYIEDKYGDRTWSAPVAYDSADNAMSDRAAYFLSRYKDLTTRVASFTIMPRTDTNLWPKALGLEIGDRITVNRTPLGDGAEISLPQIIEGITHVFSPLNWTTSYRCSPAETRVFFILDDDTYGVLDDDILAY